ncbi:MULTISPECIES: RNase adapter RapZ [unclassified Corynebacterium]|uniref:RNase adapter RapZ n=1 Tax=unclassified Corynebacterium TaxID=2624378 RepID=UPI0008A54458|nr:MULTISPECIES: RNase adapter RapZ [unclassified Corynebacterium]MDK7134193.1 RNase adapter RapZ [Corynebacterium sp. UMB4614]OFS17519.1 RNase adaptor protein RapZ [Corynebacterium sp. HMSC27B11]
MVSMTSPQKDPSLILVTGMSGAGRRTAAAVLEEMGWYVTDNLPPELIVRMVELSFDAESPVEKLAIVTDVRSRSFAGSLTGVLEKLVDSGRKPIVLFLEASDEALISRFDEVRRSHPLQDGDSLQSGIDREREMLNGIKQEADIVVDTSSTSIHDLRRILEMKFSDAAGDSTRVVLQSFGFKHGAPRDVDILLDVRFLPNPYWVPELRGLRGVDKPVSDYVLNQQDAPGFLDSFESMLLAMLPGFHREGKGFLSIGIGCTGGHHRSVAVTEEVSARLRERGVEVRTRHRDLERG